MSAHLRALAESAAAPEDAFEPALRAIVEATKAGAGAICLYDQRHDLLRLAGEVGLSDEGCRRLRTVRKGDVNSWDMPLHGMLNRRAYLIETAARNRYVPPLVDNAAAVRTIACIPLLSGTTPLGSLILVTLMPQTFSDRHIRLLEQPLREIVAIIEAVRRLAPRTDAAPAAVPPAGEPSRRPAPPASVAARAEEVQAVIEAAHLDRESLETALAAANAERVAQGEAFRRREQELLAEHAAQIDALRARLAEAEAGAAHEQRAREELQTTLERSAVGQAGADQIAEVARRAETARAAAEAETARLADELERARAAAARTDELVAALDAANRDRARLEEAAAEHAAEIERLQARLAEAEAAAARELRAREALSVARDDDVAERKRGLHGAIERARAAEEARDSARAELATLHAETTRLQGVVAARDAELTRLRAELERFATIEEAARADRARLEEAVDDARRDAREALAALAEVRRQLEQGPKADAGAGAADTALIGAERDRLQESLAAAEAERARLAADVEGAAAARTSLEEAHAAALEELRARERELVAEVAARDRELESLRIERELSSSSLQTCLEELGSERDELRDRLARATEEAGRASERETLGQRMQALEVERDRLATELEASRQGGSPGVAGRPAAPAAAGSPPASARPAAPPAGRAGAPAAAPVAEGDPRHILVIDAGSGWDKAASSGFQLQTLAPADAVAAAVQAFDPGRIVVNLSAKGALEALAALRAGGVKARCWGCLGDPKGGRAVPLGLIEPATRPLDPDAVLASLGPWAARGTRVVTVGADVDALVSLRQALARQGLSVSMAWDAKQAADLLSMVKPDVVVVDLGLPARDGCGIVARLGTRDPIPTAVLIPGPADPAPGFALAATEPANAQRALPLDRLLARVLAASEPRPPERR